MAGDSPLSGLRVVDLSTWIAGGYCTKLLTDAGADVVKVESAEGDALRGWSASGAAISPGTDGALFNFLHASQRSVVVDVENDAQLDSLAQLLASADAVIWSRGSSVAEHPALSPAKLLHAHPHLTITAITAFGLDGPWSDKPSTEFTLQAWSGGIIGLGRGTSDRAPVYVGGQVGEWVTGLYAAIGTLASTRRAAPAGQIVDLSMLEVLATTLTYYPVTFFDLLGRPMRKRRVVVPPSVAAAQDGLVGLGVGTGQQWLDFCAMVGHPEWTEDRSLFLDRAHLAPDINAWVGEHTVDEVLDLATAFRIPNAPIVHGANAEGMAHFLERSTFVKNPTDGATNPRPAYRLSSGELRTPEAAPRLGADTIAPFAPRSIEKAAIGRRGPLPFSGLRVLDMTAYWAGPLVGHVLSMLGADVIHLESPKRPDGARMVGGVSQKQDQYWERGPIFAALNANKKSLAIDLSSQPGRDLLRRFVSTCDVVVENFTPRVLDQLGLSYESLREVRPDLVMVRMPGFGLDGPWRELAAFAFVIEDASGLTWLTGHPDQLPLEPYCVGDPNAGLHALFGMMVALEHRDKTGEGCLVEAAMVDAALNITAEQVIEQSAYGTLLSRSGNRGPLAMQNVYHAAGPDDFGRDDSWVAIAVTSDEQWDALAKAIGRAQWATGQAFATAAARAERQDEIDAELARWCRERTAGVIVENLWAVGVPVAEVIQPHRQADLEQFQSRAFFEELEHPVVGACRYSTLPMRFSAGPDRVHRRHAPLLGEHNCELLGDLGLTASQIDALEAAGVIGQGLRSASGAA